MADLNKSEVIQLLIDEGIRIDLANQYADVFKEYIEATQNIDKNGIVVLHPRTANPIENPYLVIRDRALKKLQAMETVQCDQLWSRYA
jgi:hypothetical protein